MHRCGSGFLLTLALAFVTALAGCLGKSSNNSTGGGVATVSLNPSGNVSLEIGKSEVFSASGKNAGGSTVTGSTVQYIVQSGSPNAAAPLSIASNGNACAGTWDVNVAICSPGSSGIALVTAVIDGVSSPVTTVYVHQHVDSIQIRDASGQPPYAYDCFPQGKTWQYSAAAFSNNLDISTTVGPMNWSSSNAGVVNTTPTLSGNPGSQVNFLQTTAAAPGITQIYASVSGTSSQPLLYTTCLIQAIYLQISGQNTGGNSITVNNGGSVSVKALAIDTLYNVADFAPLSNPPLTWSTSNPEVVSFTAATNSTGTNTASARNNLGGAVITASCTPPTCNIGLPGITSSGAIVPSLPLYASDCNATVNSPTCPLPSGTKGYSAISVNVTTVTSAPTYTAWAATTGCQNLAGCSSALFPVTPGATPIGTIASLPRTPNSMLFNHSTRLYIGSDQGLMYLDVTSTNPTVNSVSSITIPCNVSLCGKVLAVSNDGSRVAISDKISTPSQVYIYNGTSGSTTPVDLILPGETATAAAFSPDELKLFVLTNTGRMYIYSTVDALTSAAIANSVTDVKFSANGSFAYVSGDPEATSVSGFATCDTPTTSVIGSAITTSYPTLPPLPTAPPFALYPLPAQALDSLGNWTQVVLALDPPNVDTFGVNVSQGALPLGQYVCVPPSVTADLSFPKTSVNLGLGNFTPLYAQLVANGREFVIVALNVPAVIVVNVSDGSFTSVPLANSAAPLSASSTADGSEVFVAACDQYDQSTTPPTCSVGSIHIVSTTGKGDFQQVPYVNAKDSNDRNMCNNAGNPVPQCLPDLVVIKPQ